MGVLAGQSGGCAVVRPASVFAGLANDENDLDMFYLFSRLSQIPSSV